jgi:hypothetical protein
MFFMSFFSLVKTGVHHILQDMDVTGAGALRSTISRPSENDDGEREKEREREIMKRDSTCGDIWRLNSFIYTMDDMDEHRFSGHYLTLITFFIVFLGSCLDLFSLGRRGRSRGDAAVKGGLVVTVSTLRAFDSGMPGAQVGGRHASIIIDL